METAIFWVLLGLVVLFAVLFVISFFKQKRNLKWVAPLLVVVLVIFVFQGNISELTIKVPGAEMSLKAFQQTADSAFAGVPMSLPAGQTPEIPAAALAFAERIEADPDLQEYLAEDVTTLLKLGNVQYATGKVDDALATYDRASAIAEQRGDETTQAAALGNMSLVYQGRGEEDKALEYQQKVLDINRATGNKPGEAAALSSLGRIYREKGEVDKALEHQQQALEANRLIDNKQGEAAILSDIGEIYRGKGETDKALECLQQSLEISREIGDKENEVRSLSNIGLIQNDRGDSAAAFRYLGEAEAVVDSHDLERSREAVMRALNEVKRGRIRR